MEKKTRSASACCSKMTVCCPFNKQCGQEAEQSGAASGCSDRNTGYQTDFCLFYNLEEDCSAVRSTAVREQQSPCY